MPMSPLEIEIRSNATNASSSIDGLKDALGRLKPAVDGVKGLTEISKALEVIGKSKASFTRIASGLSKLSSSMNGLTDDGLAKMERLATALERIAGTGLTNIPKMPSGKNAETQVEESPVSGEAAGSGILPTNIGNISSLANVKRVIGEIVEYLKKANKKLEEFFGKLKKDKFSFLSMIPRMAYRRAIMMFFSAIISGAKEGVKALYQYSKVAGTAFAPAYEAMQKTFTVVQNSFGSALGEILMSVMPIIQQFCQLLIQAANFLAQLFAALRGATDWSKAIYGMNAFQKATNGAGKSTKELLADIDELNVITSEGGSGGSNSNNMDYGKMFEQATVATWLQERLKTIKALVIGIGAALIAWKLSKGFLGKFAWLAYAAFELWQFYENFKDAWDNGLDIDNVNGMFISLALAVTALAAGFKNLKAAGITSIAGGILLIALGIKDIIDNGEVTKEALKSIGAGFAAVGAGILIMTNIANPVGWVLAIAGVVTYFWDEISTWWENDFKPWLDGIWTAISTWWNQLITDIKSGWDTFWGTTLPGWISAIGEWWNGIWDGLSDGLSTAWDAVTTYWNDTVIPFFTGIGEAVGGFVSGIWNGLTTGLETAWNAVTTYWNDTVVPFFTGMWDSVKQGFTDIINGVIAEWNKIIATIQSAIDKVKEFLGIKSNEEVMQMMQSTANNPQDDSATAAIMAVDGMDWWNYQRANGGFVPDGQLFLAREAGAELVGSIGNRTAVANNDQITAGIASAVASANTTGNSLLSQQNAILMQLLNKKTTIEPSAQWGRFNQRCAAMYAGTTG